MCCSYFGFVISKLLIGADGANSIVRREFIRKNIIRNKDWQFNLGTGLECFVNRQDLENDQFKTLILTFGFVNYGYNWLFPNKERIVLGVGALNRKNKGNFLNTLKNFISSLNISTKKISPIIAKKIFPVRELKKALAPKLPEKPIIKSLIIGSIICLSFLT